jgi:hypothetical protein
MFKESEDKYIRIHGIEKKMVKKRDPSSERSRIR